MFHIYNFGTSTFQDWLDATDQLYLTKYLYLGGQKKDYCSLQQHLTPQPQNQYLLYIDDQVGVCGSAVITSVSDDFEIEGQLIPQGTWALSNVLFYIKARPPFHDHMKMFDRIMTQFHVGLFEYLWDGAQASSHHLALSFQSDLEIHKDLRFFGGFTFQKEITLEEDYQDLSLAVMLLNDTTYQAYIQIKSKNIQRFNADPCLLFSKKAVSISEVSQ